MARWIGLAVACWCVAVPAGAQEAVDQPPLVAVTLEDPEGRFAKWTIEAQRLVTQLFQDAGVAVTWRAADLAVADRTLTVTISAAAARVGIGAEAMGVAPSPGDGTRGTQAYVFGDRLGEFAAEHAIPVAYVLACAVAHELGHLLLPPNAHDGGGIMRGSWNPRLFPPKSPGIDGFTPAQARLLRLRARRSIVTNPGADE
jgi:hypothetical protein